ncbi:cytochrome P450 [Caldimonas brevitalea]|uniref:Cytochrome P450 n=2 Tax=Caldimonas brevitalea TaxID=413882 RepID=A0A0G3BLU3_9BURK|nr:cytochrome P450 [Caldimonas brevitalea]
MPSESQLDSTIALLANPYSFITERCNRHGSELFTARIMLQPTICMSGPRAAQLFYDARRFTRVSAAPEPLRATLFGDGGVQTLDGEPHKIRKGLFMAVLGPDRVAALADRCAQEWHRHAEAWARQGGQVVLYPALHTLLTAAVCDWAGVPVPPDELPTRAEQLTALFDRAAAKGAGHLQSRRARKHAEDWISGLIEDIRGGRLETPPDSAAARVAQHRDADGSLMPPRVAAVELLNVLRPTVAVSVFIVQAAHALHVYPECRLPLQKAEPGYADAFVDEVRRYYPFFPAVVARVRDDFEWEGYHFPKGRRVMLDLHGTNRDPRAWRDPDVFRPERFRDTPPGLYNFIPQGGDVAATHHRCPGEGVAKALTKVALDFLVQRLRYRVPEQDLRLNLKRLPCIPHDGFVIEAVELLA